MRVLLLCGDHYHPGDIPAKGLELLQAKGITTHVIQDINEFKPEMLKDYPVVIISKSGRVISEGEVPWKADAATQDAFIKYVEDGGGLLVTHSGTVAEDDSDRLNRLIGCKFSFHPNQTPVTVQPIKPHPITEGVGMFDEKDEHYHIEILASDIDIIAAAYGPPQGEESKYETEPYFNMPGCITAAGYVRTQGKGRVCVLTPGHNLEVWLNPNYQQMLENAIRWCAG